MTPAQIFDALVTRGARWLPRRLFWELRAQGIHRSWGNDADDFALVGSVIDCVHPRSLIDIGCGSGRLFPVYLERGIERIVGQDISRYALSLARRRYPEAPITLIRTELQRLPYADKEFDLCISNRVLSGVSRDAIRDVLRSVIRVSGYLYLNEYDESDFVGDSAYWLKHDYRRLLDEICSYETVTEGVAGMQTYRLFRIDG